MGQPHESLVAWQRADDLCVRTYQLTHEPFPRAERYQLSSQLRRAAYSVAANIVEGYAFPEGAMRGRFLRTAIDSLAEVSYGFHLALRVGHITGAEYETLVQQTRQVAASLIGLLKRSNGSRKG